MNNKQFGLRQLLSLGSVILLSPALRLFPQQSTALSGSAAWLTPLAALPLLLLYMYFLTRFMSCRREGEGFAELTVRALGSAAGRVMLGIIGLWLLLYTGCALRAGAGRLVETVYPNSSTALFSIVTGLLALLAASGSPRSFVRMGRLLCPVLAAVLLVFLSGALFRMDTGNIRPVTSADVLPILRGALVPADLLTGAVCVLCFSAGGLRTGDGKSFRPLALWTAAISALLTMLSFALIGRFGTEVCARLTHPFFVMVRNIVFFRSVERIEALAVSLWIFPDFLLCSVFLWAGQYSLRLALGYDAKYIKKKAFDLSSGRWLLFVSAAAAIVCALIIAPDAVSFARWSQLIIPAANLTLAFVVFPTIFIIGKQTKRL